MLIKQDPYQSASNANQSLQLHRPTPSYQHEVHYNYDHCCPPCPWHLKPCQRCWGKFEHRSLLNVSSNQECALIRLVHCVLQPLLRGTHATSTPPSKSKPPWLPRPRSLRPAKIPTVEVRRKKASSAVNKLDLGCTVKHASIVLRQILAT